MNEQSDSPIVIVPSREVVGEFLIENVVLDSPRLGGIPGCESTLRNYVRLGLINDGDANKAFSEFRRRAADRARAEAAFRRIFRTLTADLPL